MWQDSAAQFPPCIPATPDELLVLVSQRADRTLSPRGFELGGMFYTSDSAPYTRRGLRKLVQSTALPVLALAQEV